MIRLIIAIVLLALSLLTVMKAPTNFFWRVAVAITEFPFIPLALVLLSGILGWWAPNYKWILLLFHAIALVLFSLPILNTYSRTATLEKDLVTAFGKPSDSKKFLNQPYSFGSMFSGILEKDVPYQSMVYKTTADRDLKLDFYPSATGQIAPCIVIIHGGSWQEGDSQQLPDLNSYLALQGYQVATINYSLAPNNHFPAPVEDTKDAISYLTAHAAELKIDTSNFVLIGRSAGGQIALMAAYTLNNPAIKGVISLYAPADMAWGARIKTNKMVLDADKVLSNYIGGSVENVPEKYELATANNYVTNTTVPTLLIHGPIDAMVSYHHSTRLKKVLDQHKVPNYLLDLPTSTHGCDYNFSGPSGQTSTFAIERFISVVTD